GLLGKRASTCSPTGSSLMGEQVASHAPSKLQPAPRADHYHLLHEQNPLTEQVACQLAKAGYNQLRELVAASTPSRLQPSREACCIQLANQATTSLVAGCSQLPKQATTSSVIQLQPACRAGYNQPGEPVAASSPSS
ncbi:hypothetical protein PCANC_04564, partial [Puccinia coronata f. sp. avenae]